MENFMKKMKNNLLVVGLIIVLASLCQTATAQFSVKIPKIGKPKPTQPPPDQSPSAPDATTQTTAQPTTNANASGSSVAKATEPTIARDSVQVTPWTYGEYRDNGEIWSWVPMMAYRVNGPIASGDQLYAEFNVPGAGIVTFDCRTAEKAADDWLNTKCGGRDSVPENKATTYTGVVSFAIKMRNELAGGDRTLFTGKAKITKAHSNEAQTPKFVNHFVYYADHDWNMPIGYVFYEPDTQKGMDRPVINVAFWVRGDAINFQPHLFYKGTEIGKKTYAGEEVGKANCDMEVENGTTQTVADNVPQKAKWTRIACSFNNVRGWDKTGEVSSMFGPFYTLDKNPGEYEFKLLWNNHLARSIKFTVKPDGNFDNGIAAANKLGSDRTIVPVQILGDQDGAWDRAAWKTDAFYGNALSGFSAQ